MALTPYNPGSFAGTVVDVAMNSSGDAVAVYVGDGYNGRLGDDLFVVRYVDGVWQAPELVPFPAPYTTWVWWSGYYGTPRAAINDSGAAVVAVWATMRRADYSESPIVWVATSSDISVAGSFGSLTRVDSDGAKRASSDVSVGITGNGHAVVAWLGVAAEDPNVALAYAATKAPSQAWSSPLEIGRRVSGPVGVGAADTEATLTFVQHTPEACANPLAPEDPSQNVACHGPVARTYDTSSAWSSSFQLDTPSAYDVAGVKVARNGVTSVYAWTQYGPYPLVDNGSRARAEMLVEHGGASSGVSEMAASSVDSTYSVEAVRATSNGQAIVLVRACRYIDHGYSLYCRPGVEVAEFDGEVWTERVIDFDAPLGGYEATTASLALSNNATSLNGAVLAWIRGPRSEDLSTEGLVAMQRVDGVWTSTSVSGVTFPSSTSNLATGVDASGNAVIAGMGRLKDWRDWDFTSPYATMLGSSSVAGAGAPTSVTVSDGSGYEGRPLFAVNWSNGLKFNHNQNYLQSISYEVQLYKQNGDASLSEMTGFTCSSSYSSCNIFDDPGSRLLAGDYVVKGRARVGSYASPWSQASEVIAYVPVKTPSNPGWWLQAEPLRGGVKLTWQEPTYAGWTPVDGYRIEYRKSGTEVWKVLVQDTDSLAVTRTVTGIATGTYLFRVFAQNSYGFNPSLFSTSSETAIVGFSAPSIVRSLEGVGTKKNGKRSITFTWAAPADNGGSAISGYQFRLKSGNGWTSWSNLPKTQLKLQYTATARQSITVQVRAMAKPGNTALYGPSAQATAVAPA